MDTYNDSDHPRTEYYGSIPPQVRLWAIMTGSASLALALIVMIVCVAYNISSVVEEYVVLVLSSISFGSFMLLLWR